MVKNPKLEKMLGKCTPMTPEQFINFKMAQNAEEQKELWGVLKLVLSTGTYVAWAYLTKAGYFNVTVQYSDNATIMFLKDGFGTRSKGKIWD